MSEDKKDKTLIGAIYALADKLGSGCGVHLYLDEIVKQLAVYQNAASSQIGHSSNERVELCYTVGTLKFYKFDEGKGPVPYGLLDMDLFNLDGRLNGRYQVVWKPEVKGGDNIASVPVPAYKGPWDKVVQKIPPAHLRANSNAAYRFDGHGGTGKGTLYATGPANLLITPVQDGGAMFQISVATYITDGDGDFEGARGTNTALGSSYFTADQIAKLNFDDPPLDAVFPGVTVSTFRFVPRKKQKP